MNEKVFIEPGRRTGRVLQNEPAFRKALGDGSEVYTKLNGVHFRVSLDDADGIVYSALERRPEGL